MDPQAAKAAYARALSDTVSIAGTRFVTASTTRDYSASGVRARIAVYQPQEIVGTIMQGDQRAILLTADLDAAGYPAPQKGDRVTTSDGRTLTVQWCDPNTRRVKDTIIAYECQCRG